MRQLGRKHEAFDYIWTSLGNELNSSQDPNSIKFSKPQILDCSKLTKVEKQSNNLNVICVKYGTKYGADYVNKLYWGVKKNLTKDFKFWCFTENGIGLDENIGVKPLKNKWAGWWSKVHMFNPEYYEGIEGTVFYIDLDMVISGNIDDLASY